MSCYRLTLLPICFSDSVFGANEFIEEQNTVAENELREKVGRLKSLTIDIGEEIKGHNILLSEADNTFDRYVLFGIFLENAFTVIYYLLFF